MHIVLLDAHCSVRCTLLDSTLLLDDKTFESAFLQVAPRNWYFKILFPKHVQLGLRISFGASLDQQQSIPPGDVSECKFAASPPS